MPNYSKTDFGKVVGSQTDRFIIFCRSLWSNSVDVKKFKSQQQLLKVPQVGWNQIFHLKSDLFKGIPEHSYIYNVHSYYANDSDYTIANCSYGLDYAAAIRKDNFYGVQFHTEKSAETGDHIIKNFLKIIFIAKSFNVIFLSFAQNPFGHQIKNNVAKIFG